MCNQGVGVIRTIIILYIMHVCIYVILSMLANTSVCLSSAAYMHSLYHGLRFTMRSDLAVFLCLVIELMVFVQMYQFCHRYSANRVITEVILQANSIECLTWSVDSVGQWLADIGLPHLSNLFIQNNVNGRELLFMESARLKVMYMCSRSPIPKNQDCLRY